jgi:undecaprenyl diphosphate synthase
MMTVGTQASSLPVPQHIAIIMDGNGRWAKKRGLPRTAGHAAGAETFRNIATYCNTLGVKYLTVYAFSTENWKRSAEEVGAIMKLLGNYLQEGLRDMEKNRVRIRFFGDLSRLDPKLQKLCIDAQERSSRFNEVQVNFCLNYGGRDEIVRCIKNIATDVVDNKIDVNKIDEDYISNNLDTRDIPDPDLLIRPGGEVRISNYLLWQLAYAEMYFTDAFWPDFDEKELVKAIEYYNTKERRYGNVK